MEDAANSPWTLAPGRVAVWVWQVGAEPLTPGELAILDSREQARAARFRPSLHRTQWVRSHTGMRRILAGYLGCKPGDVVFRPGSNGKPGLDAADPPAFNLSHTEDWCALAVAAGMEIGLDIQVPHGINHALWRRVLTPGERAEMTQLALEEQNAGFFRCWTRKEAVGKADSQGVYVHLKRTETGVLPHAPGEAAIVMAANRAGVSTAWHVADLPLPGGLYGALATSVPADFDLRTLQEGGLQPG